MTALRLSDGDRAALAWQIVQELKGRFRITDPRSPSDKQAPAPANEVELTVMEGIDRYFE